MRGHDFDVCTEACIYCGSPRLTAAGECHGGKKPKSWLLLTPRGNVWVTKP